MSSLSQNSANLQLNTQPIISSEVVLVTVPMAQNWLSTMIENQRKPSGPQVAKYAREMANGKWEISAPLSFNHEGQLIDGQHRLLAVVKSQKPTLFLIVRNLESSAALKFDLGKNRTTQNIAHLHGYDWINHKQISTYTSMFISPTTATKLPLQSMSEKLDGIIKHKDAIEFAVSRTYGMWKHSCFSAVVARAYYSENHERLEQFLEVLTTGVCKVDGDSAAAVLREFWMRRVGKTTDGFSTRLMLTRLTTSALKRFLKREKTKVLQETKFNFFPVDDFDIWWKEKQKCNLS
jgi:hypothetical protein